MRAGENWKDELLLPPVVTSCISLIFCKGTEDASKILSNDGACPICDQVLSKSLMKPVETNPSDEWVNDLEMQAKMNKVVGQCRQKCESMQEKFTEKLEQVYTAYQKATKRCQMLEQALENLNKDKQELQEKFSEKCRQKRKLDEMYDQARNEIESLKRSAIQPANHFFSRPEPDLFSNPAASRLDNRDSIRKDWSVLTPDTPGPRADMWPARHNSSNSTFDMSGGSPAKQSCVPTETENRMPSAHPSFGVQNRNGAGTGNPSMTLRNLILSPIKRPQLSRSRPQMFM
ncbi:E3 ubiquitin-protein ligase ccnb1ip1 homolog [Phtheirospermum japonicum]|uniref:E3 ubiquitin-protein ligase ccnb1ip1 homolog n=1 Tax=Phtheirospermum japonicum TaxID=374723 RepID=A0A830D2U2_9LAMI|nr:E3 ubiquitin-protein ligase ccnb1ip1 homolog [Phtheirospermum japonicum]